jgi:cellobiose phosphorylase
VKENGGVFSQSQGWLILAEALIGDGDMAYRYFLENAPSAQNEKAEIRRIEPYAYGQFTEGKASPNAGRSHVHWLTGTASTVMVGCVEGILGMRPDLYGLKIDPSIPKEWDELTIEKDFRGKHLSITIKNPDHKCSGVSELILNGAKRDGNYIPETDLSDKNTIEVVL